MKNKLLKVRKLPAFFLVFAFALPLFAQKNESMKSSSNVFQPSQSPLVSLRIQFLTGSIADPQGKEGAANLTAAMIAQGGSKKLTNKQITEQFNPMATSFGAQVDKEMTTFSGTTHVDNLDKYYGIISQMLLDPGFREDDFKRLKDDQLNFLKVSLREGNDEELGKERLYNNIYGSTGNLMETSQVFRKRIELHFGS
ncbi:MAG: insulinase family protein [Acidobacteria bacterium]|nr:insulinase family protein [Acidobacteriota bacterium]